MGVCTACNAETADDQMKDGKCPNCAGATAPAAEAPAAEAPAAEAPAAETPAEGGDAPAA